MTMHTRGPWTVGKSTVSTVDGFRFHGFPVSGDGQAIARVWNGAVGKEALSFGNQEANAKLIGASPRLLRALARLVAADNCNYQRDTMRHEGMFAEARAALAEASEADLAAILQEAA